MSALARLTSMAPGPGMDALRRSARRLRHAIPRPPGGPGRIRRARRVPRAVLAAGAASALAAAVLAAAGAVLASRPAAGEAAAASAAPVPHWIEIHRPIALYDLPGTEYSRLPSTYRARRREPDGAREDAMTFGHLGEDAPFLQLSLLRAGPDGESPEDPLADALARLAGDSGLQATRLRPAAPVDTRLGRFEAADLLLWKSAAATACLGFRGGGRVLRLAGFACGAPGRPLGRAALACALDRLDLVSAGEDAALRDVFVAAERDRDATCLSGPSLVAVGPSARRGWLDPDGTMPPLRGLFEVTIRRR